MVIAAQELTQNRNTLCLDIYVTTRYRLPILKNIFVLFHRRNNKYRSLNDNDPQTLCWTCPSQFARLKCQEGKAAQQNFQTSV